MNLRGIVDALSLPIIQIPKINVEIWTRPLANETWLIAIVSRYVKLPLNVNTTLTELGIPARPNGYTVAGVRALGSNIMQQLQMDDTLTQQVKPSGVAVMKAIPIDQYKKPKTGRLFKLLRHDLDLWNHLDHYLENKMLVIYGDIKLFAFLRPFEC